MNSKITRGIAAVGSFAVLGLGMIARYAGATTTVDLSTFNQAVEAGQQAASSMAGTYSLYGILLAVALIGAGVVIWLIFHGARKGKKALTGKF